MSSAARVGHQSGGVAGGDAVGLFADFITRSARSPTAGLVFGPVLHVLRYPRER
jgi:hypothetical protein